MNLDVSRSAGWQADKERIKAKCHKNTYNYCVKATREKVAECIKGEAMGLIVRHSLNTKFYQGWH